MESKRESKRIGEYLVDQKILSIAEVDRILELGKLEGLRFGEAGKRLGILDEEMMVRVFKKNHRVDFFRLDPRFISRMTVLTPENIIRYGALPLGFKKGYDVFKSGKVLNLGMIDPGREDVLKIVQSEVIAKGTAQATKVYLVLAEQFLEVLEKVYGVDRGDLSRRPADQLEPTLSLFLGEGR